jgi:hypothetical protein
LEIYALQGIPGYTNEFQAGAIGEQDPVPAGYPNRGRHVLEQELCLL